MHSVSILAMNILLSFMALVSAIETLTSEQILGLQATAQQCLSNKDYTRAEQFCKQIIQECTEAATVLDANKNLVRVYLESNRNEEADAIKQTILEQFSTQETFPQALGDMAYRYSNSGRYLSSRELSERILRDYPEHSTATYALGVLILNADRENRWSEADQLVEQMLSRQPGTHTGLAGGMPIPSLYLKRGEPQKSLSLCNRILERCPGHRKELEILGLKARSCLELHDGKQADEVVDVMFGRFSDKEKFAPIMDDLVVRYSRNGQASKSVKLFNRIKTRYPSYSFQDRALDAMVCSYSNLGRRAEMDVLVDGMLSRETGPNMALIGTIPVPNFYLHGRRYDKALEASQRILNKSGGYAKELDILHVQARCYLALDMLPEANATIKVMCEKYSEHEQFARHVSDMASHYARKSDFSKSEELIQIILKNPAPAAQLQGYVAIARSKVHLGDDIKVQEQLELILADFPHEEDLGHSLFAIGEEYYIRADAVVSKDSAKANSDFGEAIKVWEKNINQEDSGFRCEAYYYSGIAYQYLNDPSKAAKCFETTAALWPNFDRRWHALSTLAILYEELQRTNQISSFEADEKIKQVYQEIIDVYPETPPAQIADMWLRRI